MREVSFMWAQQTWQWFQELEVVSWALILFLSVFGFFSASQSTEMFEPNPSWHRRLSGPCDIFAYSGKQKHSMNIIKEPLNSGVLPPPYCIFPAFALQSVQQPPSFLQALFVSSLPIHLLLHFQHHSLFLRNQLNRMFWLSSFMSPVASFFEVHRHTNAWMCKYRRSQTNTDTWSCSTK